MSLPDILREIIAHKREELRRVTAPLAELRARAADALPARDFAAALRGDDVRVIAEIKRASPSEGTIRSGVFDAAEIARTYEASGAAALSVLTDERFFGGHLDHLRAARAAVELPVLRKDFVLDERQVIEARAAGADAVLLIAAVLDPPELHDLHALTRELG
ncbi:MAG: indole-3-glycerol phosphate synthase TrpC, partial [Armatimonadota bacterium]